MVLVGRGSEGAACYDRMTDISHDCDDEDTNVPYFRLQLWETLTCPSNMGWAHALMRSFRVQLCRLRMVVAVAFDEVPRGYPIATGEFRDEPQQRFNKGNISWISSIQSSNGDHSLPDW